MDDQNNYFFEIKNVDGFPLKAQDKITPDFIPEVIVNNMPVELQEFYYSHQGTGHRKSYNFRSTMSLDFEHVQFPSPLKSKLHSHDYYEATIVVTGKLEIQIESQLCELNPWDVCILNCTTRHAESFFPGGRVVFLALSSKYLMNWPWEEGMSRHRSLLSSELFQKGLRDSLHSNKDYIISRYNDRDKMSPLNRVVNDIRNQFENKQAGYQLFIRGLLYRLFDILGSEAYDTKYVELGADNGFSLAFSAKQILDKNKRKMTMRELAGRLNYSAEYIDRVFRRHYGQSIAQYNKSVYLRTAAALLHDSNQDIHEICKRLGFSNRTHFYSLFKAEYGCTPAEYRKMPPKT